MRLSTFAEKLARKGIPVLLLCFIVGLMWVGLPMSGADAEEAPPIEWVRQLGTSGPPPATAGIDTGGGYVYVAGPTWATLPGQTSAGEGGDAFVRKYDASGNEVWTRQFGTSSYDEAWGISVDSTGVYIAGWTYGTFPGQTSAGEGDAFVRKYDVNGNEVWTRQFGTSSYDYAFGISVDSTGVYVTGYTYGTFSGQTSAGDTDAFVRKYDVNGNEVWTRQFGTSSTDWAFRISVDSTGVYIAGQTDGTFPGQTSAGAGDAFVRKYDVNGNEVWTRQFGTSSYDYAYGISVDSTGVYVTGHLGTFSGQTGDNDDFVRKYDVNGNEVWTRQFGTSSYDAAGGISVDSTGVYVTGDTYGTFSGQTSAGENDAFVRKYDVNGNEVWTRQFGTSSYDSAGGISVDSTGVYIAGSTDGTFPGQTGSGPFDAFVAKLSATGSEQPQLKAPWQGKARISQGNSGSPSHYDHGTWDNTYALDIALYKADVLAPADGVVVYVDNDAAGLGGKELAIEHKGTANKPFTTVYLHLDSILVSLGASVKQGQRIAISGNTSSANIDYHLHFHMWSGTLSYDAHTKPIERLVLKQVGVDTGFREYDARKGELSDAVIADKWFESNNVLLKQPPTASFTYSPHDASTYWERNPGENEAVEFNASASSDSDGTIVSYRWDFSDGEPFSGLTATATHAFARKGTYKVTLTVTDDDGATNSTSQTVKVVPAWRKDIRSGDILFDPSFLGGIGHAGIVDGTHLVVEAQGSGVNLNPIESWDTKGAAYLLRVSSASNVTANAAAALALTQVGKLYDPFWVQKSSDMNHIMWYCSELVWATYKNQGIDLFPRSGPVSPLALYNSSLTDVVGHFGEDAHLLGVSFSGQCPIDLVVADPTGLIVSKTSSDIPGSVYMVSDVNEDGSTDTWVGLPDRKVGNYTITVVPQPGAQPTDTYTLKSFQASATSALAENIAIENIPEDPYVVESNGYVVLCENHVLLLQDDQSVDVTTTPQTGIEWVVVKDMTGTPVGAIRVDFEQAMTDIDLSDLTATIDSTTGKSVLHIAVWPPEIDESRVLYVPSTGVGEVYVCPGATSLAEVSPDDPNAVSIRIGQTVNGMTVGTTTVDGIEYYVISGVTGTGAGEADNSQNWYLHSDSMMYRENSSKPMGVVSIAEGASRTWIANEAAGGDAVFPPGPWQGTITTSEPLVVGDQIVVSLGSWDGSIFAPATNGSQILSGDGVSISFMLSIPSDSFTVNMGQYLAVQIENPVGGATEIGIVTGQSGSYITSPDADPGYPISALASVLLMGLGLATLGGVLWWSNRRRKVSATM